VNRKKPTNHNISLTFHKKMPDSSTPEPLLIMYNHGSRHKVARKSPVDIPQKIFDKKKQEIKKAYREVYPSANEWIIDFNLKKNDVEMKLAKGVIDKEQAYRILRNEYNSDVVLETYRKYATEKSVKESIIQRTEQYLGQLENKFAEANSDYSTLHYDDLQKIADIERIIAFIDSLDVRNATKKKYLNYLNKATEVNPNFAKDEKRPFNKTYEHGRHNPKRAVESKDLKLSIGEIKNNPYKLEAMLWWLLSFCLRGIDCADILVMDEKKLEGEVKGKLKDFIPSSNGKYLNKIYYVGNRSKMEERESRVPLKILFNVYPVLIIHQMLKRLVGYLHPDIAYKGNDKVKIYNLNYLDTDDRKKWNNRLGNMSDNTKKLFGATMKQTRNTFSTILASVMNVGVKLAEKELSTALGHTNSSTQKLYVNPDQTKQDLLQIEAIESFGVRKVVKNIIATCQHYTFKANSEEVKLVETSQLNTQYLDAEMNWWGWKNELEYQQEKKKAYSDVDTIIIDGVPVQKEVFRPTARFKELHEQRDKAWFTTFIAGDEEYKRVSKKIHKAIADTGFFKEN